MVNIQFQLVFGKRADQKLSRFENVRQVRIGDCGLPEPIAARRFRRGEIRKSIRDKLDLVNRLHLLGHRRHAEHKAQHQWKYQGEFNRSYAAIVSQSLNGASSRAK